MVAEERHESASFQNFCGECITTPYDQLQFLMFRIPHGENHAAAFGKLRQERLRNSGSGSGNEDGIERSEFRQTERAVAAMYVCVLVSKPGKLS